MYWFIITWLKSPKLSWLLIRVSKFKITLKYILDTTLARQEIFSKKLIFLIEINFECCIYMQLKYVDGFVLVDYV